MILCDIMGFEGIERDCVCNEGIRGYSKYSAGQEAANRPGPTATPSALPEFPPSRLARTGPQHYNSARSLIGRFPVRWRSMN